MRDILSPKDLGPDHYQLSQAHACFQRDLFFYFLIKTSRPWGKGPGPRPQAITGSAKHVAEFEMELCHSLSLKASGKALLWQGSPYYNRVSPFQMVSLAVLPMWQNFVFLKKKNEPV